MILFLEDIFAQKSSSFEVTLLPISYSATNHCFWSYCIVVPSLSFDLFPNKTEEILN